MHSLMFEVQGQVFEHLLLYTHFIRYILLIRWRKFIHQRTIHIIISFMLSFVWPKIASHAELSSLCTRSCYIGGW